MQDYNALHASNDLQQIQLQMLCPHVQQATSETEMYKLASLGLSDEGDMPFVNLARLLAF